MFSKIEYAPEINRLMYNLQNYLLREEKYINICTIRI